MPIEKIDKSSAPIITKTVELANGSTTFLSDLSPGDKPWDKHRKNVDRVASLYRGSKFQVYSDRMTFCSEFLKFGLVDDNAEALKLRLRAARFCRVRHCPVCQWRRSLMWKAKAYKVLPKIVSMYPKHRWLFLTLTVRNCPIAELKSTLTQMNKAFQRFSQVKAYPADGWLRSTEVTRGKDGSAHPHFHCLLMVPPGYFAGKNYLRQSAWAKMWKKAMRLDYDPILDVRAIKEGNQPMGLIPEILKYCVKESDLTADRDWLIEYTKQMHKMRCVATGGVLKQFLRELEDEPENLVGTGEDNIDEDEFNLFFNWVRGRDRYRLVE
jgi:plasmid rolling circle replication initiator protein Rep